jgi:hypothetical protein
MTPRRSPTVSGTDRSQRVVTLRGALPGVAQWQPLGPVDIAKHRLPELSSPRLSMGATPVHRHMEAFDISRGALIRKPRCQGALRRGTIQPSFVTVLSK